MLCNTLLAKGSLLLLSANGPAFANRFYRSARKISLTQIAGTGAMANTTQSFDSGEALV